MGLTILICPNTFYGSVNPCIGISQILHNRGHRIIFAICDTFKGNANKYGFEEMVMSSDESNQFKSQTELYNFLGDYFVTSGYITSDITPLEKMRITYSYLIGEEINRVKDNDRKIKEIIDCVNPDIILVEATLIVVPSVVKSERPWVVFGAANPLSIIEDLRTPPTNSGLPSHNQTEWNHFRNEYYRMIKPIIDGLNNWLKEEEISPLPSNTLLYESPHINIYNYPKELDYDDLRPTPIKWAQFDAFVRVENEEFIIPEFQRNKTGKLIFLTMGTFTSFNVEMMKHLIEMLSKSSHRYILSKGMFGDHYELSDNMWGHSMVPQTKVMPIVDMVIIHGGQNSIVEAFYFGKPMIVLPVCNDQFDNAQRVVEKGFGLRMDPNKCTEKELITAIDDVLNNKELANRMKQISLRIQNDMKSNKLALLFEDLMKK